MVCTEAREVDVTDVDNDRWIEITLLLDCACPEVERIDVMELNEVGLNEVDVLVRARHDQSLGVLAICDDRLTY